MSFGLASLIWAAAARARRAERAVVRPFSSRWWRVFALCSDKAVARPAQKRHQDSCPADPEPRAKLEPNPDVDGYAGDHEADQETVSPARRHLAGEPTRTALRIKGVRERLT